MKRWNCSGNCLHLSRGGEESDAGISGEVVIAKVTKRNAKRARDERETSGRGEELEGINVSR